MAAKIYSLDNYREPQEEEACIDELVSDWTEALHNKLIEIINELGYETACQFHHRVCGTDLQISRRIVSIILENDE